MAVGVVVVVVVVVVAAQFSVAFNEIQKQFATEFDYRGECQNAIDIRSNLQKSGWGHIIVPEVYPELCTRKMLVMEEVRPAVTLQDALDAQAAAMARKRGLSKEQFMEQEKVSTSDRLTE
jgi:predicted unusual protein kinase regulating ubiquinone biosynthesis (AarF/ABC1/UbiB family)